MKKALLIYVAVIIFLLGVGIFTAYWSPWIGEARARTLAEQEFEKLNKNTTDGCGIKCENCGAKEVKSTHFGKNVLIEYNCGGPVSDASAIPPNHTINAFVSFLGSVHIANWE